MQGQDSLETRSQPETNGWNSPGSRDPRVSDAFRISGSHTGTTMNISGWWIKSDKRCMKSTSVAPQSETSECSWAALETRRRCSPERPHIFFPLGILKETHVNTYCATESPNKNGFSWTSLHFVSLGLSGGRRGEGSPFWKVSA